MKTKSGYYFFEFITTATSLADSLLHTSHTFMPTVYYILHTPSCLHTSHTFMFTYFTHLHVYILHTPSCLHTSHTFMFTYFTHLHGMFQTHRMATPLTSAFHLTNDIFLHFMSYTMGLIQTNFTSPRDIIIWRWWTGFPVLSRP